MTPNEFKLKYPEYKHLEGDILWDLMTEMLISECDSLTADPNREIVWGEPIICGEDKWYVESEYDTVWLDKNGNKVKLTKPKHSAKPTESYKMVIWDASEENNNLKK